MEEKKFPSYIRSGIQRPNWITRNTNQNVVLLRDSSSSMDGKKAKEAFLAGAELVEELANPSNKDGFNVAVIDFADEATITCFFKKATALKGNIPDISADGCTSISSALEKTLEALQQFSADHASDGIHYLRPVVLIFTDGEHNTGPAPQAIAEQLKESVDIVSIAFGNKADENLLKQIASSSQHFYRCKNGKDLRGFLATVGKTLTQTMFHKMSATKALSQIKE